MNGSLAKPLKSAEDLRVELEWAAHVLTGDASSARILFALPTLASSDDAAPGFNWDVEVSCRPEQDEAAQSAILHVASKWNLAEADAADCAPPVLALAIGRDGAAASGNAPIGNGHAADGYL